MLKDSLALSVPLSQPCNYSIPPGYSVALLIEIAIIAKIAKHRRD
jgi:hypothetical protein